ncbi:MAG: nucleotidyltransferase family protein [Longimicrobiales bacterium]
MDAGVSDASELLTQVLRSSELVYECLRRLAVLDLPNWYLGAGCIAQTVWNAAHGYDPTTGIVDYDIVYFDPDLSPEAEDAAVTRVGEVLSDLPLRPDVKNQARVHLWYAGHFGYEIRPYASCEDAIATWPTTATAIGVRLRNGSLAVEAPFGVDDLFGLVVRPNRVQITPDIYLSRVERWTRQWPLLTILDWDAGVGSPGIRRAV